MFNRSLFIACALLANLIILPAPSSVEAIKVGACDAHGGCEYYQRVLKLDYGQSGQECQVQYHCLEMHNHTCRQTTSAFSIHTTCPHPIVDRGRCLAPHQNIGSTVCPGADVDI